MPVYARIRSGPNGPYLEYFVQWTADHGFTWSATKQDRFASRVLHTITVFDGQETIYIIDSKPSARPGSRTRTDLLRDGLWIVGSDAVPKGGNKGLGVAPSAVVYGITVSSTVFELTVLHVKGIYTAVQHVTGATDLHWHNEPIVVYHGTAKANVHSILKDGLQTTFGMFGTAVYFGSFWKAFRFATLTQDYEGRSGAVLRCYAYWKRLNIQVIGAGCKCAECQSAAKAGKPKHGWRLADHQGLWQTDHEAVVAWPCLEPDADTWIIKNEEYAARDASNVTVETVAFCEPMTKHHEPLNRSLMIL